MTASNLTQPVAFGKTVGVGGSNGAIAQEFTTGNNTGGYTLTSVTLEFGTVANAGAVTVSIRGKQSNGQPATTATTTLSGTPVGGQKVTFTCSTNCALAASTDYFVYVSANVANAAYLYTTMSDAETLEPSGNGWSIADAVRVQSNSWALHTDGRAMFIGIEAVP